MLRLHLDSHYILPKMGIIINNLLWKTLNNPYMNEKGYKLLQQSTKKRKYKGKLRKLNKKGFNLSQKRNYKMSKILNVEDILSCKNRNLQNIRVQEIKWKMKKWNKKEWKDKDGQSVKDLKENTLKLKRNILLNIRFKKGKLTSY